jgi:hypothetical protein
LKISAVSEAGISIITEHFSTITQLRARPIWKCSYNQFNFSFRVEILLL